MKLKLKRLVEGVVLPEAVNSGDAGFDLAAIEGGEIKPGERLVVGTGLASEFPEGWVVFIKPRSGLAMKFGIDVLSGVIDSGYRGEWKVILINLGQEKFVFQKGERIAQAVLLPVGKVEFEEGEVLEESERGAKGFGSSGR